MTTAPNKTKSKTRNYGLYCKGNSATFISCVCKDCFQELSGPTLNRIAVSTRHATSAPAFIRA